MSHGDLGRDGYTVEAIEKNDVILYVNYCSRIEHIIEQ